MRKIMSLILALLMTACASFAAADSADTTGADAVQRPYYKLDELGVKLYVDADWEQYARSYDVVIELKTDYDDAGVLQSGMMIMLPAAYDKSDEDNDYDARGGILGVSVRAEGAEAVVPGEEFAGYEAAALGSVDGYEFTLHMNTVPDDTLLDDDGKAMVKAVQDAFKDGAQGSIDLKRPATQAELNTLIPEFSAQDLSGADVDKSVLKNAPYTLIDIWATSCPPCIDEMPELNELAEEYAGRVQFLGIVSDAMDADTIELAGMIAVKTGVTYASIVPDEALYTSLLSQIRYTPTKVIVDQDGVMVGEPIIGAQGKDVLRAALDALPGVKS